MQKMVTVTIFRGFTLFELLLVLAIVVTLLTLALPRYFGSIDRSKEAVLKENLYQMREAISRYHADKGKYPESLESLAGDKYLGDPHRRLSVLAHLHALADRPDLAREHYLAALDRTRNTAEQNYLRERIARLGE